MLGNYLCLHKSHMNKNTKMNYDFIVYIQYCVLRPRQYPRLHAFQQDKASLASVKKIQKRKNKTLCYGNSDWLFILTQYHCFAESLSQTVLITFLKHVSWAQRNSGWYPTQHKYDCPNERINKFIARSRWLLRQVIHFLGNDRKTMLDKRPITWCKIKVTCY